jgi:hypothetical protein
MDLEGILEKREALAVPDHAVAGPAFWADYGDSSPAGMSLRCRANMVARGHDSPQKGEGAMCRLASFRRDGV